jgi:hypothetical protein
MRTITTRQIKTANVIRASYTSYKRIQPSLTKGCLSEGLHGKEEGEGYEKSGQSKEWDCVGVFDGVALGV